MHERCDNKGKTIIIIKSMNNEIFGGYIDVTHKSYLNDFTTGNGKSFIFSLTKSTKHICINK